MSRHSWSLAPALIASLLFAGCQSYSPMPLDDAAHAREWKARDINGASVRDFAAALAKRDAAARTYNPADGLDLAEAEVVALFFNARLRKARLDAGPRLRARKMRANGKTPNSISAAG